MILLDSGGQYVDGTTDVTRTFHMGTPTDYQMEMFTRVLKGNIAIDSRYISGFISYEWSYQYFILHA
jgi:Xaa-Pro aminopeptidase